MMIPFLNYNNNNNNNNDDDNNNNDNNNNNIYEDLISWSCNTTD